ncbi:hypothetical protein [Jiangella sp. DSM 45060]|nr:hypothetical protein [Jiangella sp. DSM 45060]SDT40176.1 hypothetical protein SAMN04515669_3892 [Jiangella sp. DSM 45060]
MSEPRDTTTAVDDAEEAAAAPPGLIVLGAADSADGECADGFCAL